MTTAVEVIAGSAGSGKTEHLLARYRRAFAQTALAPCLWLAPTHRAAVAVRGRLLAGEISGCLEPRVMTFDHLAEQLISKSPDVVRSIDRLVQRRIIAQLISEATEADRFDYFQKVAQAGSLVDLATEWIIELKRLEIWPDQFEAACTERGLQPRDRELVDLYRRYQTHLGQYGLYDAEGRVWSARSYLQQHGAALIGDLRLVIADGFADFTRTQHEILQTLDSQTHFPHAQLYVSLPLEQNTQRPHLFHKSQATLNRLAQYHETIAVQYQRRSASPAWPTLAHIETQLFASPNAQQPIENPQGVEILAAESELGECKMIGRRIKRLLLEGDDTGQPVKPQQVAVVFRSASQTAPLVAEVFDELGIPYALETPRRLGDATIMSALLALLRLASEDWPYRALLGVLGNNYVDLSVGNALRGVPPELRENSERHGGRSLQENENHSRRSAERIVRHLQIPKGRRKLLEQVKRLAQLSVDEDAEQSRLTDYIAWAGEALSPLTRLAELFDALPSTASLTDWYAHLAAFATDIGMIAAMEQNETGADTATDLAAWQKLADAVAATEKADSWAGHAAAPITLSGLVHTLADLCSHETLPLAIDDTGCVRVLSAPSVRGISVDYLFVAGLSEKSFPSLGQQEALYSADDYSQLRQRGLPLVDHTERSCDEMLLFYEVITRATRRLWLTYAALDENGQPLCPSPYLTEVERACGDGRLPHRSEIRLSPVPQGPTPLGNTEWRLLATSRALDHDAPDTRLLAAHGHEASLRLPHANLLAGLSVVAERQTGEGFGQYEGVLIESAATAILQQQFGPDKLWSATELEEYGLCPHRFFLNHVLDIDEPEELTLELDYGARGRALHETLTRAHRHLNSRAGHPQSPSELDEARQTAFQAELLEMLRDTIADLPAGSDVDRALLEVNRREIEQWVVEYFEQHRAYDDSWKSTFDEPPRPAHFEVAYGLKPRLGDDERISTRSPHEITLAGEKLKISGRVDRIDVGKIAGRAVFNIIDYKTARKRPGTPGVVDGTSLQLELYAMATEELLLADEHALPWQAGYWMVRDRGFRRPLEIGEVDGDDHVRPSDAWLQHRQSIIERLTSMVRGIRAGQFPMYSADENCTGMCPYRTVCRVNQTRNLEKQWQV